MEKVYRIQHKDWLMGPYARYREPRLFQLGQRLFQFHMSEEQERAHPDPFQPGEPWDDGYGRDEEIFGFVDMEALKRWFEGWLDELMSHGFEIVTFEIPYHSLRIGDSGQVSFRTDGRPVNKQDPSSHRMTKQQMRRAMMNG